MKTFNETFLEFNKKYSIENLYLKNVFSKKSDKVFKWLGGIAIFTILLGLLLLDYYKFIIGAWLMLFSFIPLFIYFFIYQSYLARNELKANDLPRPQMFPKKLFIYKSEKLNDCRIKEVFTDLKDIKSDTIIQNIKIASQIKDEPIKNPFEFFEKILEHFGKIFLGVMIGIFVSSLRSDFTSLNFKLTIKYIAIFMLLYFLFAFIWNFMFKKAYFDNIETKNKKLKDFILVMENVLLLRKQ